MFIKRTNKRVKGKIYTNHLLVESVATPKGPRHRVICSLGSLEPGPAQQWLGLARRIEAALGGQLTLLPDRKVDEIVAKARSRVSNGVEPKEQEASDLVSVHTNGITIEQAREAGPVHVGHQMWKKLDLDTILTKAGLNERSRCLTEVRVMNRLINPNSEHKMPHWIRRTALADLLGIDFQTLGYDALYRNLDQLYPRREQIEKELGERENTLFN